MDARLEEHESVSREKLSGGDYDLDKGSGSEDGKT